MALSYPSTLAETSHPAISFKSSIGDMIFLPIPTSLEFADSATYDDAELGYTGKKALGTMETANSGGFFSGLGTLAKGIYNDITTTGAGSAAAAYTQLNPLMPESLGKATGIATGTTLNKNITSEFTGVGTREFSFSFNMMPYSQADAISIKNIVFAFRKGIYPEGNDFALKYPPKWTIAFLQCGEYIPKIAETYLRDVSTTYNSNTNMWRSDGAPLDTTLSLTFKETKALTLKEIQELG
jgi:hypothetical protein